MESSIGPDRFPISTSDKLFKAHLLLNERLDDGQPASEDIRIDLSKWKKVPPKGEVLSSSRLPCAALPGFVNTMPNCEMHTCPGLNSFSC